MKYDQTLIKGRLIKRYKRFLADVELESGEVITAHTANTGAMTGLTAPGSLVYLSFHDKPSRKLKYSWELIKVGRTLCGINTALPNALVEEGVTNGTIAELSGYGSLRREVRYGERKSRIDVLLEDHPTAPRAWVEVKNVTLMDGKLARFPDAVTTRGRKHLLELRDRVAAGDRGVLVFVVQRSDANAVGVADAIDPAYGETLREAMGAGVEVLAYQAKVTSREVKLVRALPVRVKALVPLASLLVVEGFPS
jgi:sugar fermentation stimulation protein A